MPCGKCNYCLQTKRGDWTFRLLQEQKVATSSHFLTFTYHDEFLPLTQEGLPTLRKEHFQLFMKRLRKVQKTQLRYYAVGEYGTKTERPHYHAIMFNLETGTPRDLRRTAQLVAKAWNHGYVHFGDVNIASIHYTTKYVVNRTAAYPGRDPPFALMSRKPAIGANYLDTHRSWHQAAKRNYSQVGGQITRLPRYYKEKLYNRLERKEMALEAMQVGDLEYWNTVERLKRFHDNPEYYYEERIIEQHENMRRYINKKNTF